MEKDQIIKLPINETPMIRCYRIHAYVMNILDVSHMSNWEKYVISHYLCLHNGAKKIARDYLDFHLENNYTNIVDGFRESFRPLFVIYIVKIRPILKKIFNLK